MADKIKVLFMAANPLNTYHLRVDEEAREIDEKIQIGTKRDCFEFISVEAVRTGDLQKALLRHQPHIVHFSGHGHKTNGIILEDNSGDMKPVRKEALASLFNVLKDNIRIVVLNACYSKYQLKSFSQIIDFTIGMNKAIGDKAAIVFAAYFYQALAFGRSVKDAFDLAKSQLRIEGIPAFKIPEMLIKDGADASQPLSNTAACQSDQPEPESKQRTKSDKDAHSNQGGFSVKVKGSKVGQVNRVNGDGAMIIGNLVNKNQGDR